MVASISTPTGTFAQRHLATGGALQRGCVRRWAGSAELDGALFSPAFWHPINLACSTIFRGQPALGAFISGSGTPGAAFWSSQYHGFHPSAIQCSVSADCCNANLPTGSADLAYTSVSLADGCPDEPGLHDGTGRAGSADGYGQRDITCSQRWLRHQPRLLRPSPARSSPAARIAIHSCRYAQVRVRLIALDTIPQSAPARGSGVNRRSELAFSHTQKKDVIISLLPPGEIP